MTSRVPRGLPLSLQSPNYRIRAWPSTTLLPQLRTGSKHAGHAIKTLTDFTRHSEQNSPTAQV
jgi:hypothetical protein